MDDLRSLAFDFAQAPRKAQRETVGVLDAAALRVKNEWRDNARQSAGSHAPAYPNSISYDFLLGAALRGAAEVEIGPDKTRPQGALGNLIEFGSVNNPPHNDGGRALREEIPRFEKALADSTLDALGWR